MSLVISFLISILRSGYVSIGSLTGFPLAIITYMIVFPVFTFIILKKSKRSDVYMLVTTILLGSSILDIYVHLSDWDKTLVSFIDLPCRWLAIIIAFYCYCWVNYKMRLFYLLIFYLIFFIWFTFRGFDLWAHKLSFGTFSGRIIEDINVHDIVFTDEFGKEMKINQLGGEYILLDFWFTSCGACFVQLPDLQKLYTSTIRSTNNKIYSVCCYNERKGEDNLTGNKILSEKGYDFPVLSINIQDSSLKDLGVDCMPIVLIINSERKLVFRGSLKFAKLYLREVL